MSSIHVKLAGLKKKKHKTSHHRKAKLLVGLEGILQPASCVLQIQLRIFQDGMKLRVFLVLNNPEGMASTDCGVCSFSTAALSPQLKALQPSGQFRSTALTSNTA